MSLTRIGVASLALLMPTLAFAHQGSMEDQVACTPDVYRLCAANIPDEDAIASCLRKNKAGLSPACQKVFAKPSSRTTDGSDDD